MNRNDKVITAIREKSIESILALFFDSDFSYVNNDFTTETELWDYKELPVDKDATALEWAELAKDVLSFYNTGKGGVIFWGISDKIPFEIVGIHQIHLDSKIVNDKIRSYIGDRIWVELSVVPNKQRTKYIGLVLIPPSGGGGVQTFTKNGPEKKRKCLFLENGTAIRENDSSYILSPKETIEYKINKNTIVFSKYEMDESGVRLLTRDYTEFLPRYDYCNKIIEGLENVKASVVSLTGIGGVGKTALATWAVRESYRRSKYEYIVSITAKDRELTSTGIQSIQQSLTTLDDLLDAIADVIGIPELKKQNPREKKHSINEYIANESILLFVDNLETTSDVGIIQFLNDLPEGVKAIVTSRRSVIKFFAYPIEVGPLTKDEITHYIKSLSSSSKFSYCIGLSQIEMESIGEACNGIPLAIKWMISRCKTVGELLTQSDIMAKSGLNSSELLEFTFRRVFDKMTEIEKGIIQVLSLIDNPPIEAIIHALRKDTGLILDTLDVLVDDTLIYKSFDNDLKAYRYSILSFTRYYVLSNCISRSDERLIKRRLTEWYEATDIPDESERRLIREMRQGNKNIGSTLIDFAKNAYRRGDYGTCKRFLEDAMRRDPKNWIVYKELAEYYRHYPEDSEERAIEQYKLALSYAEGERMNSAIAIAHREFGILYSKSGEIDSTSIAIQHLEIAISEMPHDGITANFLSNMYLRKGAVDPAVKILERVCDNTDRKTLEHLLPILLAAYNKSQTKYLLQISKVKQRMDDLGISYSV
jgi:tetratricopeptide (TPR) repeat protein